MPIFTRFSCRWLAVSGQSPSNDGNNTGHTDQNSGLYSVQGICAFVYEGLRRRTGGFHSTLLDAVGDLVGEYDA